jgi:hypothetical protein
MRKPFPIVLSGFVLNLLVVTAVFAQSGGGVKGKVKNMNGDGISGATITARLDGRDVATTRSSTSGSFSLGGLAPGVYNFVFDAKGYATGIRFAVEIKEGKVRDLGDRLILLVDRGSQILVQGSVFYKDGTSAEGAKVEVERISSDGSVRKIGTYWTNRAGEFSFRQPDGARKFRITASLRGVSATKEVEIEAANVYRMAISLDLVRE